MTSLLFPVSLGLPYFTLDNSVLYLPGVDARILFWDLAEGTLAAEVKGHTSTVYSLAFSREGNMLASGRSRYMPCLRAIV